MKNRFTLFAMLLISTGILAQSPVKVDFDKDERALDEVHEPGYESWVITNCVDTTKVINGIKITMANGKESDGASLKSHWHKVGIQAPYYARLVSDGLTVNGGDMYAEIDMTIEGLAPGSHSLLTYHNTLDSPDDKTFGMIDVFVNGELKVEGLMQSNRALSTYDAATAYVTFDYGKGMHSSDGDKLRTFEIAEHDGLFVPAEAQIIDGKTVKVWSGQIRNPKFVRYGWQPFTRANLVNEAGLPASTFRSEAAPVSWFRLPDLPGTEKSPSLGVSAPFTGVSGGQLFVAGGCNFPGKPAAEGGTKEYYCNIYALDITARSHAGWKRIGKLPIPLAYGASVTTPEGLVWIGGNNNKKVSRQVFFVNWDGEKQQLHITELPPLPMPLDNLSATYADGCLYVAGGKGKPQTVPIGQDGSQTAPTNPLFSLQLTPSLQKEWVRLPDFPGPARIQPVLTAQQSEDGIRLYLAGGFQPASAHQEAIVCTDMLSYHPKTKQWRNEGFLPSLAGGSHRTVTGGCAIASGDSSILLVGGVNYDRFRDALNHPEPDYLLHPVDWYKFNTSLLQYNTFTKHWTHLGNYEELARAGAGIANNANTVIIIGGELKPGIRTPEVNAFKLTCHP